MVAIEKKAETSAYRYREKTGTEGMVPVTESRTEVSNQNIIKLRTGGMNLHETFAIQPHLGRKSVKNLVADNAAHLQPIHRGYHGRRKI